MCQRITKMDVANSLSRLTGSSLENNYLELIRIDKPSVVDKFGNVNLKEFRNRVNEKLPGVAGIDVVGEGSRLTGKSYENTFMEMNRIDLKSGLSLSLNPLPPLNTFK